MLVNTYKYYFMEEVMQDIIKKMQFLISIIIYFTASVNIAHAKENHFIISEDQTLTEYIGNETVVTVPDTVKIIGDYAFNNCTMIEEIIIPKGVTEIHAGAFSGCTNLKHIILPSSLTTIKDYAFNGCSSLKEITIPKSVTSWDLDHNNLYYDDGIEKYNVDSANPKFISLDGIVYNKDMTALLCYPYNRSEEEYTIPDSVTDISKADFSGAKSLKHIIFNTKVTMEYTPSWLDTRNFLNGTLENITVPDGNETFCDIDGVLYSKDKKILIVYPEKKKGKIYKIPEGTARLYEYSFSTYRTNMELKYVLFPDSIRKINDCVGYYMSEDDNAANESFIFFGKKGSVVETYAMTYGMHFSKCNPSKDGEQLLLTVSNLSLTPKAATQIDSILVSSDSPQTVFWKSSDPSIVSIDQLGNISAKKIGTVVIYATTKTGLKATCNITVKLSAPTGIKSLIASASGIKLTWNKVSGATSYTIYRLVKEGQYKKIGSTTKLDFTDNKVKEAVEYDYRIISNHTNPSYSSEYSDSLHLYIPCNVTNVTIIQGLSGVEINWNTDDYSYGVLIYRATSQNGKYTKIYDKVCDFSSFTDTNVISGTTYYYKVQAYCYYNEKAYSRCTNPISIKIK